MSLTDHVAILLYSSLDQPRTNRLNPNKPAAYFAQIAFPPAAANDLQALCAQVAPGGNLQGQEIGVQRSSQLKKPIPGIPGDWLVVRSSSQYPPTVMDASNQPVTGEAIKSLFYPGRRIRAALSTFAWAHTATNRKGVSFNLQGVMDAGPGERLAIGDGVTVNAFEQYAQKGIMGNGAASSPAPASTAGVSNPFADAGAGQHAGAVSQPIASTAGQPDNPFAQ